MIDAFIYSVWPKRAFHFWYIFEMIMNGVAEWWYPTMHFDMQNIVHVY